MPGRESATVLVVDDHLAFAEALVLTIATASDLRCVGTATTLADGVAMSRQLEPDVVVADLGLPDAQGVQAVSHLRKVRPDQRVLVLTGHPELGVLKTALDAGAAGVLHKDVPIATVLDAIRNLPEHAVVVSRTMLAAALQSVPAPSNSTPAAGTLSPRELKVLRLLAAGQQPKTIAAELGIAVSTCRGYVKSLLVKLGAHSQLEAVSIGRQNGLID